jgi:glycosyltransferase involved in cell wall biosynthesis
MEKIPCSVCILTYNSGKTLLRALESTRDFDEILICDGGSTDDTLRIAANFGGRVIIQDPTFKGSNGKLKDFAGARNQYLRAAAHDWIFALDSDEYVTKELAEEIRSITQQSPAAYWVSRKYEFRGTIIERAMNYPSRQMRFFHRSVVQKYIKPVHERIAVRDGAPVRILNTYMVVPVVDESFNAVKRRWGMYIELERTRHSNVSLRMWLRKSIRECAVMALYGLRLIRVQLLQRGARFPLSVEMRIFWYQWSLIAMLFKKIDRV